MIQWPDTINSCFEAFGAYAVWRNVYKLRQDRDVKGVVWEFGFVWWVWGLWNMVYYSWLHQWWSMTAGAVLALGNFVWLFEWLRIRREDGSSS